MMTSTPDSCKDGASKLSKINDGVCEMNDMLQNISTEDKDIVVSICANCGKENSTDNMNICNKCNQVKYCNAACKKKHRSKHKKQCDRRVAELHDEKLFKQPPSQQHGDCPICFLRLPALESGYRYHACCGKVICSGCVYAPVYDNQGNKVDSQKCPYCRTPWPSSEEELQERYKNRVKAGDPQALNNLGVYYKHGRQGFPQDYTKALAYWHRAGELGNAEAFASIGFAYYNGKGVEVDETKAKHYHELAAIGGDTLSRYYLGIMEVKADNLDRAMKHHMISIRSGCDGSLEMIKDMYSKGYATKEDYTKALRAYQEYLVDIKSPQRDKAAATYENCRYY